MVRLINPKTTRILIPDVNGFYDPSGNELFPIVKGAYRFCEMGNYTSNFGFQWKKFKKNQIDKFNNSGQSKKRFFASTNWENENLDGKNILEMGCGAGRFTQIVLDYTKANIHSVDYSESVEANFENNGPNERLKLFQASVYEMPFEENSFEKVFCFGMLQHTPFPKKTIECLYKVLKPGGELIVDFYPYNGFWTKIHSKYILRPFLKNLSNDKLITWIERNIDWMMLFSRFFILTKTDRFFNRFIPVCDIRNIIPESLSKEETRQWAILDTFDMFSPKYDCPLKIKQVQKWFVDIGMKNVSGLKIQYDIRGFVTVVKGYK